MSNPSYESAAAGVEEDKPVAGKVALNIEENGHGHTWKDETDEWGKVWRDDNQQRTSQWCAVFGVSIAVAVVLGGTAFISAFTGTGDDKRFLMEKVRGFLRLKAVVTVVKEYDWHTQDYSLSCISIGDEVSFANSGMVYWTNGFKDYLPVEAAETKRLEASKQNIFVSYQVLYGAEDVSLFKAPSFKTGVYDWSEKNWRIGCQIEGTKGKTSVFQQKFSDPSHYCAEAREEFQYDISEPDWIKFKKKKNATTVKFSSFTELAGRTEFKKWMGTCIKNLNEDPEKQDKICKTETGFKERNRWAMNDGIILKGEARLKVNFEKYHLPNFEWASDQTHHYKAHPYTQDFASMKPKELSALASSDIEVMNIDTETETETYSLPEAPYTGVFKTNLKGKGKLGLWGPNPAADMIITRTNKENKYEVLLIRRKFAPQQWAVPGGMHEELDIKTTAERELKEEAFGSKFFPGNKLLGEELFFVKFNAMVNAYANADKMIKEIQNVMDKRSEDAASVKGELDNMVNGTETTLEHILERLVGGDDVQAVVDKPKSDAENIKEIQKVVNKRSEDAANVKSKLDNMVKGAANAETTLQDILGWLVDDADVQKVLGKWINKVARNRENLKVSYQDRGFGHLLDELHRLSEMFKHGKLANLELQGQFSLITKVLSNIYRSRLLYNVDAVTVMRECLKKREPVYKGMMDDVRNTDNAWMQTTAFHVHCNQCTDAFEELQDEKKKAFLTIQNSLENLDETKRNEFFKSLEFLDFRPTDLNEVCQNIVALGDDDASYAKWVPLADAQRYVNNKNMVLETVKLIGGTHFTDPWEDVGLFASHAHFLGPIIDRMVKNQNERLGETE